MGCVAGRANRRFIDPTLDGLSVDAFVVFMRDLCMAGTAQIRNRLFEGPGTGPLQLVSVTVANLAVRRSRVSAGKLQPMDAASPLACLLCVALGTLGQNSVLRVRESVDSSVTGCAT